MGIKIPYMKRRDINRIGNIPDIVQNAIKCQQEKSYSPVDFVDKEPQTIAQPQKWYHVATPFK